MAEMQLQLDQDPSSFPDRRRLTEMVVAICVLSVFVSLLNAHSWRSGGVTVIWLNNGFVLGMVLCSPRKQWPVLLLLSAALDVVLNLALSKVMLPGPAFSLATVGSAFYLGFCNTVEVFLAAVLLRRSISPNPDLTRPPQLIRLLLYGVVLAPAVASLMATAIAGGTFGVPNTHSLKYWFTADALGIATMTPLYLSYYRGRILANRTQLEISAHFLFLVLTIAAIFGQSRFPLLFLIFPSLLLIGMRLRLAGSALGLLIASIVGGYLTVSGYGPLALVNISLTGRIVFFQFFIAVAMLVLYIMEITTTQSYRLKQSLQDSETRFRLIAEVSSDIIMLSDLKNVRQYVSPAVTEVLGWLPSELLGETYQEVVHPEDVERVDETMEECLGGRPANGIVYRMQKRNGEYLWVEANLRLYRDSATGNPAGFVSVVRDFSRRKAAEDELTHAFQMAENLASLDALTGIANRRVFNETLEVEWRRSIRSQSPLSLLLFDVDHFKQFNDIYGHLEGDDCLKRVASAVRTVVLRTNDLFARYGGEEFVVILPHTDIEGAKQIGEQIRQAVENCGIPHKGAARGFVTISVGCAVRAAVGFDKSCSTLVADADAALYQAKSGGRNRVEVAIPA